MARLIILTSWSAPYAKVAYNVDTIDRVEVVPFVSGGSDEKGVPGSVAAHARIVFKGITATSTEVRETVDLVVMKANE